MCDTLVALTDDGVLFAKNSDRDANEAQRVVWHPAADHPTGARLQATWIDIPQAAHTHAVALAQPWWMWGAEMGANEHGVVIGNEAVHTTEPHGDPALLGMDLVRLALERGPTARDAVDVIVTLLERHGQGGSCSMVRAGFTYHNAFLVADPTGAFVLETAGQRWAVEEVRAPGRAISNGLTIAAFAERYADVARGERVRCTVRRARMEATARSAVGPADLFAGLRDHGGHDLRWDETRGGLDGPCAHAGGDDVSTQTTGSWVADLRATPQHWVTATSAPCTSIFKPLLVTAPAAVDATDLPALRATSDPRFTWWRHEPFHRTVIRDHARLVASFAAERDALERRWLADPPDTASAFAEAAHFEEAWATRIVGGAPTDTRPAGIAERWRALDDAAGVPSLPTGSHGPVGAR